MPSLDGVHPDPPSVTAVTQPLQLGRVVYVVLRQALPTSLPRHLPCLVNAQTAPLVRTLLTPRTAQDRPTVCLPFVSLLAAKLIATSHSVVFRRQALAPFAASRRV